MYKLKTIETGYFMADGGAMFGTVPKRTWSRKYPSDGNNLCRLAMRCVLLVSDSHIILIDTGIRLESMPAYSYYGFEEVRQIDVCLRAEGLDVDQVTDVVLTHLHFDHCDAATDKDDGGSWRPMFPNATYWVGGRQWEAACRPSILERDSFCANNFLPLLAAGKLKLVDEAVEIAPGFCVKLFDGHTAGQLACYADGADGRHYLIPGDVVPTAAHIPLTWLSAYDAHAERSAEAKMELLRDAVAENRELIFFHDAYTPTARVVEKDGLFMLKRT